MFRGPLTRSRQDHAAVHRANLLDLFIAAEDLTNGREALQVEPDCLHTEMPACGFHQ
jgi:hypothetical protein